ncbi:MAG: enoyl-CoA hydratase [Ardenticatenaceae bacterium]|nr:enoyl-CoA hydratase [Ardenticatenaceae bacterium]HBY97355.1 enoyl-CoA hydratase [Chloroflexota bacterium]
MEEMQFERRGPVAILTVNRPTRRNAMTWEMYERLVELCELVDGDDEIRVWILRGAGGKAFISGTDISQFKAFQGNPRAGLDYEATIDRIVGRLAAVQKPTMALIDGFAIGGGLMLALNCDIRIATSESRFSIPCINLGNCLSMANYAKLVALVGPSRTLELMYTGRQLDASEAMSIGMVNAVVPSDDLETYGVALATRIARSAPITVRVTKEAVRRIMGGSIPPGDDLIQACYNSRDFQEGVSAFLEKRSPEWQAR